MKKTLTVITLLAGAVSGYSQGELLFNLYASNLKPIVFNQQVGGTYSVTYAGSTVSETVGDSSAGLETPKGTTVYTGTGLSGTGYDVELLGGPAGITAANGSVGGVGLTPISTVFNFKTGAANSGIMNGSQTITLPTTTYYGSQAPTAISIAVAAWNNESGTVTTLASAVSGGTPWGISQVFQTGVLNQSPSGPSAMPADAFSFSLGTSTSIPEPSTIALGVMGASALLFRRRK